MKHKPTFSDSRLNAKFKKALRAIQAAEGAAAPEAEAPEAPEAENPDPEVAEATETPEEEDLTAYCMPDIIVRDPEDYDPDLEDDVPPRPAPRGKTYTEADLNRIREEAYHRGRNEAFEEVRSQRVSYYQNLRDAGARAEGRMPDSRPQPQFLASPRPGFWDSPAN